jgi:PAS domain S-box-containing protein
MAQSFPLEHLDSQSAAHFRDLVNSLPDAVFEITAAHELIYLNPAWQNLTGLALDESLGRNLFDYIDSGSQEELRDLIRMMFIEAHEQNFYQTVLVIPKREPIYVELHLRRLGEARVVGIIENVTSYKLVEKDLIEAREHADFANRAKTEFLANISHELRTPLNGILGFSEIIRDQLFGPVSPPSYREYAIDIHESGEHLLELIGEVLDVAKIEAGKRELDESVFDLNRLAQSCFRLIGPKAERRRITMSLDFPTDLPHVMGEVLAMKQILVNLVSNAVKYTAPGGTVKIWARRETDGGLRIGVTDNGIGIAPQDIPIALTPFGQVQNLWTRRAEGTGLGLTLVTSLVALHQGKFELESELGKGTTALVILPADRIITPTGSSI